MQIDRYSRQRLLCTFRQLCFFGGTRGDKRDTEGIRRNRGHTEEQGGKQTDKGDTEEKWGIQRN